MRERDAREFVSYFFIFFYLINFSGHTIGTSFWVVIIFIKLTNNLYGELSELWHFTCGNPCIE